MIGTAIFTETEYSHICLWMSGPHDADRTFLPALTDRTLTDRGQVYDTAFLLRSPLIICVIQFRALRRRKVKQGAQSLS